MHFSAEQDTRRLRGHELAFAATIKEAIDSALRKRGIANILVAGKTGVGKSTLINAIFQGKMASTGQGRPVTAHTEKITKKDVPVSIYDTRGLELNEYRRIISDLTTFIQGENGKADPTQHIHVGWLCIAEGSRRVERAEIELAEKLSDTLPIIVVITTAIADNGFRAEVKHLIPHARNVIRVNSIEYVLDAVGTPIPPSGLDDLVGATMEVIPDGQRKRL